MLVGPDLVVLDERIHGGYPLCKMNYGSGFSRVGFDRKKIMKPDVLFWFYKDFGICRERLHRLRKVNEGVRVFALYGGPLSKAEIVRNAVHELVENSYLPIRERRICLKTSLCMFFPKQIISNLCYHKSSFSKFFSKWGSPFKIFRK